MKNLMVIMVLLMSINSIAQDGYEKVQGYYNLSEFETAIGLYLLKDKTFFMYASFGNVDLQIYGTYSLSEIDESGNQNIFLHPDEDLLQNFFVYGAANEQLVDKVSITYYKPFQHIHEKLNLNKTIDFPEFKNENKVNITINTVNKSELSFYYRNASYNKTLNNFKIKLNKKVNELLIFKNNNLKLIKDLTHINTQFKNDILKFNGEKRKKQELTEEIINNVKAFINTESNKSTIVKDGITYKKTPIHKDE